MVDFYGDATGNASSFRQPRVSAPQALPAQNSAAAMYRDPASQGGRPNYLAQHLHEVAIDHANGVFACTNNYVLEIGGTVLHSAPIASFPKRLRAPI
jgi:hypothetical protein